MGQGQLRRWQLRFAGFKQMITASNIELARYEGTIRPRSRHADPDLRECLGDWQLTAARRAGCFWKHAPLRHWCRMSSMLRHLQLSASDLTRAPNSMGQGPGARTRIGREATLETAYAIMSFGRIPQKMAFCPRGKRGWTDRDCLRRPSRE